MDIPGYEGLYQVYEDGRVFSIRSKKWKAQLNHSNGYMMVSLAKDNKDTKHRVHRLVALCYLENPENKKDVDHIDGNRKNNHVSNLRWATRSENLRNSFLRSDNKSGHKGVDWCESRNKWRACIRLNSKHTHLGYFETKEEAAAAYQAAAKIHYGEFYKDTQ